VTLQRYIKKEQPMPRPRRLTLILALVLGLLGCQPSSHPAHSRGADPGAPTPAAYLAAGESEAKAAMAASPELARAAGEMAQAALNLWAALTPEQQKKASFEFKDDERLNWHFVPRERKGLPWTDMTVPQRHLAHAFLSSGLGQRGYAKAVSIMSLEEILRELEAGRGPKRDPELYFFSVFGKPGGKETWGWRVEGHHLALNFTVVGGKAVAGAPSFFGANPGEVRQGPRKGLRVLAAEEDLARQLVKSLSDEQKQTAITTKDAPRDILTGNKRKISLEAPTGLAASKMTPEQQAVLKALVAEYAHRLRPEMAEQDLAKIQKAGWDKVHFDWRGGVEPGEGHYYRIQGTTFLIEYDNTQNNANHIHAVWRDPANDFGEDLLKSHYEQHHAD
jgi:hypothetical protein